MTIHTPVLLQSVLGILSPLDDKIILDATFGGGGHSLALARSGAKVIALDKDPNAIREGEKLFSQLSDACLNSPNSSLESHQFFSFPSGGQIYLFNSSFANLSQIAPQVFSERPIFDAALFDLGISSDQLFSSRGFSFQDESLLDMRIDPKTQAVTAAQLLQLLSARQLADMFTEFADESYARPLAKQIVTERVTNPLQTTGQLVSLIERIVPNQGKIHPATKVFQALRIAVNSEFDELSEGLDQCLSYLKSPGQILAISFHSGEDRIVKTFIRANRLDSSPIIQPSKEEISSNPRSRSAKLRVIYKK